MTPIVAPDTTRNRPRKTRLGGPCDFMRRVIATEAGGALYSRRKRMVEPVFAQVKANRGIRSCPFRGGGGGRGDGEHSKMEKRGETKRDLTAITLRGVRDCTQTGK